MANYDFKSLSSYDFECLCRDLLQEKLKVMLESFTTGRDGGVDFRCCRAKGKKMIIQVKHYAGSNFNILLNKIKKEELEKIKRKNPERYILVTSVGLTPDNKDELFNVLTPFCKSSEEIFGKDDLNNLLNIFSSIEKKNFKLWLTSSAILDKVLHSNIYTQSEIEVKYIEKRLKYYVQNESFFDASRILEELHYCIIAGIPGMGKTTLAEILLIDYLNHGFEVVKISSDISEATEVFDSNKKQIFYYDDFLGQTKLADKFNKNEDERLLRFINTVTQRNNARFILTTREYILNQAKENYEKLANSNFDSKKCVIELDKYTKFNRAKILFNHIFFSDLPDEYKDSILKNKNYWKIINHRNYNPRIIERMTQFISSSKIEGNYFATFMKNLDNPSRIWEHAFQSQISQAARTLLITISSLGDEVLMDDLEEAFNCFYNKMAKDLNFSIYYNDFRKSLKELEGNFILIEQHSQKTTVKFHNPSINDFVEGFIRTNYRISRLLLETAIYFEQLIKLTNFQQFVEEKLGEYPIFNRTNKDLWLKKINELYASTTPILISVVYPDGTTRKEKISINFEKRLQFVIELEKQKKLEGLKSTIDAMFNHLIKLYEKKVSNKWLALEFLGYLPEQNALDSEGLEVFLNTIKEAFLRDLETSDDYKYLTDLIKQMPRLFTEAEKENIKTDFVDFCEKEVINIRESDDPAYLTQNKDALDEVAEFLKIEIRESLASIDDRINELYHGESDEDYYRSDFQEESEMSAEEIDSLFDSLLD